MSAVCLSALSSCCSAPVAPVYSCLQRASCGNMRPVSKANVMFACPEFSEFDPGRTAVYPPRPDSCCKVCVAGVAMMTQTVYLLHSTLLYRNLEARACVRVILETNSQFNPVSAPDWF